MHPQTHLLRPNDVFTNASCAFTTRWQCLFFYLPCHNSTGYFSVSIAFFPHAPTSALKFTFSSQLNVLLRTFCVNVLLIHNISVFNILLNHVPDILPDLHGAKFCLFLSFHNLGFLYCADSPIFSTIGIV